LSGRYRFAAVLLAAPVLAVLPFDIHSAPGVIGLDPRWSQAALRFAAEGFWQFLDSADHLLFLACLVIPFRRLRQFAVIVMSFTVGVAITLIASTLGLAPGWAWFPPLIETLIAVAVVFTALDNIAGGNAGRRWFYAFAFGLIHGFGLSFAVREQLQSAGDDLIASLLGFNAGVAIGQLAALCVLVPALNLVFRYVVAERIGVIILSALAAHTGWHWMLDRGAVLGTYPPPTLDAALVASLRRGGMAVLILVALLWGIGGVVRRLQGKEIGTAENARRRLLSDIQAADELHQHGLAGER
jgi:HupE / UreJ protein